MPVVGITLHKAVGAVPASAAAAGPKFGAPTTYSRIKQPHSSIVKYHRHD